MTESAQRRLHRRRQHGRGDGAAPAASSAGRSGCATSMPAREAECVRAGAAAHATPAALAAAHPVVVVAVVDAAQCDAVLFGGDGLVHGARGRRRLRRPLPDPRPGEHRGDRRAPGRARHRLHRRADVGRAGARPRRQHEPDGRLRRRRCSSASGALLEALSSKLFRVGERPGDGARTKLVNNLLAAINLAGAAEAIALAERLGLDPARTLDVIEQSSGQSWIGSDRMRRAIAGDLAPRAHTTLLAKDSRLALEMAAAAGFDGAARDGRPPSASARPAPPASARSTTPACCSCCASPEARPQPPVSAAKRARSTLPPLMMTPTRRPGELAPSSAAPRRSRGSRSARRSSSSARRRSASPRPARRRWR